MISPHHDAPPGFHAIEDPAPGGRGFLALIGPLYRKAARWGFRAESRHINPQRVVHGAMLAALADTIMGETVYDALKRETMCVTVSFSCQFVSSAREGDWVEGEAKLLRLGRNIAFVECHLYANERLLLNAAGSWAVLHGKN